MYGIPSIAIGAGLFIAITVANEAGFRLGSHYHATSHQGTRAQTNAIQAAMLGLLALLLGFTFTMALQRYDTRSEAVTDEANAIGTAFLRTELLPVSHQADSRDLIAQYLDSRLAAQKIDLAHVDEREATMQTTNQLQERLWMLAADALEQSTRPQATLLVMQALNEMFDAYGRRDAALARHVPELVLLVLFAVFVIASALLGYAGGLEGARPRIATVAMSVLIVLVIFVIIDLDRPRRGIIQVDHSSMNALKPMFEAHTAFRTAPALQSLDDGARTETATAAH